MKQTDAIIISMATETSSELAGMSPNGQKSMIPLNGRPAVSYLIDSLKSCDLISKVIVVSDTPNSDITMADENVEAKSDLSDSVLAGIHAVKAERCLIMNGDMPLASQESFTDLLTSAPGSDLVYPIVGKSDVSGLFPNRPAFYVDTKEGAYTGSSCLLFDPRVALSREALLTRLLSARSNPKELLGLLGPALAMKFMFSKLALSEFEGHLSRALDMSCRVFVTHFPELLVSIDTPEDICLMEKSLQAK